MVLASEKLVLCSLEEVFVFELETIQKIEVRRSFLGEINIVG